MIEVDAESFFVVVAVSALAAISVAALPSRLAPPVVVVELVLGIVVGPEVLDLARTDDFIEFFASLGLGMLFFFAGYEIDFERIRGTPLKLGALGWVVSIALAYGIGGALAAAGVVVSFLYTGSAMATTAIGTLIPILRDSGELKTRFGAHLLAAGGAAEFGPILLVTLVLSAKQPLHEALILVTFVALALALALASVRLAWRGWPALERTFEASSQLAVRLAVVLVFGLVLLAGELGLDVLLGGFVAGMIVRLALKGRELAVFESKLTAVGFGFFVPFFFVASGIDFDLGALGSAEALLKLAMFLALFLVVRGAPALLLYRKLLDARQRVALAFYSATELPLVVAITTLATEGGHMTSSTAAGLVGAAMLSTLIFPFVAIALRRRDLDPRSLPPRSPSYDRSAFGRVAQWESARLTRERSLVRTQPRPCSTLGLGRKLGDVTVDVGGDRLADPLLGGGVRHAVAAEEHLLVGQGEAGDLPADREALEEQLEAAVPGVVQRRRGASWRLAELGDRAGAELLAQDEHVALRVGVLDGGRLWVGPPLLALCHRRRVCHADGHRLSPSILSGRPATGALALGREPLLRKAPLAGRPAWLGRAAPAWRLQPGGDLFGQALQGKLTVACLTTGILRDSGDHRTNPLDEPRALRIVERPRHRCVEDRFDPRGGHVRVLPAGTGGAASPQLDLRQGDREPRVDPQLLGHPPTVDARPAGRRGSGEGVDLRRQLEVGRRHAALGVGRDRDGDRVPGDPQVGMVVHRLGGLDNRVGEAHRADEVTALEALGDRVALALPARVLGEPRLQFGIAQERHSATMLAR